MRLGLGLAITNILRVPDGSAPAWTPASLFAASEVGGWYDATDMANLYQDSSATTAVTAVGDPVGYVADLSGNGLHLVQANATYKPYYIGEPATYGSELAPALGASWTAGTGWATDGTATTASSALTASVSLDAGAIYELSYTLTRTAGTCYASLEGTTQSRAVAWNDSRDLIVQYLKANTGNNLLSFTGASFSGSVSNISLKKVLTWKAPYGVYCQYDSRLATSGTINAAMPALFVAMHKSHEDFDNKSLLVVGNAANNYFGLKKGSAPQRMSASCRTAATGLQALVGDLGDHPMNGLSINRAYFVEGTSYLQASEEDRKSGANSFSSTTLSGVPIRVANEDGISYARGVFYQGLVRFASSTEADERNVMHYFISNASCKHVVVLGDSTVSFWPTTGQRTQAGKMMAGAVCTSLADAGDLVADQKTLWEAMSSYSNIDAVIIQVGHNNIDPVGTTSAAIITALQDLVDTVQADTTAPVYIGTLTPSKAYLDSYWGANAAAAYAMWQDINEAISGGGATPITNVDGVITSHTTTLNDGSDNLAAAYNIDGIHINVFGKKVIADAWRAKLVADGILV